MAMCDRVAFGTCLCGQAADTRETVFSNDLDHRHENVHDGIQPHGHYCVPIVTDNRLYGVINLYLQQGHQAVSQEKRFLALVADALAGAIRSKQTESALAAKETQLLAAQSIQEHILPSTPPSIPGIEIAGSYRPAEFAAGDHYDHFLLKDGSLAIGVGDVSGHGFSSALLMASTHAYIHALAAMDQPLARVFDLTNENLHHETDPGQFITAFFGRIDPATRELTFVSAGHPHGYVLDEQGEVRETLESTGLPLAVLPGVEYEEGPPVTLVPGDKVLLLTDGILEAESHSGEFFDEQGVLKAMRETIGLDAQETVDTLMAAVEKFHGGRQQDDDLTALVIRIVE
jgi:sigma-B regulation protein RsbU (phosphoserine phosphatase)